MFIEYIVFVRDFVAFYETDKLPNTLRRPVNTIWVFNTMKKGWLEYRKKTK